MGKVQAVVISQLEGILPSAKGTGYKYLGMLESNVFDVTQMKLVVQQQFNQRSRTTFQTQLNFGHKVRGINMFAVQIMHYGAALLDWSTTELNKLNVKFRMILSMNGVHHFKGDVDRLYLPSHLGGR